MSTNAYLEVFDGLENREFLCRLYESLIDSVEIAVGHKISYEQRKFTLDVLLRGADLEATDKTITEAVADRPTVSELLLQSVIKAAGTTVEKAVRELLTTMCE